LRSEIRSHFSQKVPIESIQILTNNQQCIDDTKDMEDYLLKEINCFAINYGNLDDKTSFRLVPNHKIIGQTFRKDGNKIKEALSKLSQHTIEKFVKNEISAIEID